MRPCSEFYGSDARRAPAAAPQLLTGLCRTRLDQRARAARASRTSSASGCPQEGRQPPRALLLGATSANGTHAISGRRGGTPRPAHKARATDRGTPLHLVVLSGCLVNFGRDGRSPCKAEPAPLRPVGREPAPWPRAGNSECRRRSSIWGMTSPLRWDFVYANEPLERLRAIGECARRSDDRSTGRSPTRTGRPRARRPVPAPCPRT
jgi:hypothetical protein